MTTARTRPPNTSGRVSRVISGHDAGYPYVQNTSPLWSCFSCGCDVTTIATWIHRPPTEPDQVETIAASYVPPATGDASVRLFNLSPDTKLAGMTSDRAGAATISDVHFSLGSEWLGFPLGQQTFTIVDDDPTPSKTLLRVSQSPVGPPIGSTLVLLGLQLQPQAGLGLQTSLLNDAPEGGVCKPSG